MANLLSRAGGEGLLAGNLLNNLVNRLDQLIGPEGLRNKLSGPRFEDLGDRLRCWVAAHDNDRHLRYFFLNLPHEEKAIMLRHLYIDEEKVKVVFLYGFKSLIGARDGGNLKPLCFEDSLATLHDDGIIIHN